MNFENPSKSNRINSVNNHDWLDLVDQNVRSSFQKMWDYRCANPRVRHIPGFGVQKVPPGYRVWNQITGFRNIMVVQGAKPLTRNFDFVKKYWSSTGFIFLPGSASEKHPQVHLKSPGLAKNHRVQMYAKPGGLHICKKNSASSLFKNLMQFTSM